jgi:hypothetical protein
MVPPDTLELSCSAGQVQKWQQRAEGTGASLQDYVIAVIDAACAKLEKEGDA